MEAGALLALAKLGAFALIVRAWMIARRTAEEARQERAEREAAAALSEPAEKAEAAPLREAA
ncbi:MAG: hypothetical protein AAGE83_12960 [Pseudomonadota bacterium]